MSEENARPIHKRRLQRGPTASGYRVETFHDVLTRHGATMGGLAVLCLLLPGTLPALAATTSSLVSKPLHYVFAMVGLLVFFTLWSRRRPIILPRQVEWIAYLLFISIVEELAFRLVFPALLEPQVGWLAANALCALVFAVIHYITLRWKFRHCVVTFLGAMGLSQLMTRGDFTLVVLVHWLATFLNTPFPPAPKPAGE